MVVCRDGPAANGLRTQEIIQRILIVLDRDCARRAQKASLGGSSDNRTISGEEVLLTLIHHRFAAVPLPPGEGFIFAVFIRREGPKDAV